MIVSGIVEEKRRQRVAVGKQAYKMPKWGLNDTSKLL